MGSPAFAQPQQAADDCQDCDDLDRPFIISEKRLGSIITVTATKKAEAEPLGEVPIAINRFSAADLDAIQFTDLSNLSQRAPNVSLDGIGTFRGVANFAIRGMGVNSSIPSIDPAVGVFVDGVYQGINAGSLHELFDVEAAEILRGPQGTLYGRNVTGGAVLINHARPTASWQGHFKGSMDGPVDGGRGAAAFTTQAVLSGPLADGGPRIRLGAYHNADGGWFRNRFNGGDLGKAQTTLLQGAVEADLGSSITLLARGEVMNSSGDGANSQNHGIFRRDSFDIALDNEGFFRARNRSATLEATADAGAGKITNIFGWRRFTLSTSNDIDSTTNPTFNSFTQTRQQQISNELRYATRIADAHDLTVGGYYFQQDVAYGEDRRIAGALPRFGGGSHDHQVLGLFGEADVALGDALSLNAGLRWSRETKDAAVTYVRTRAACSVVAGTCPVAGSNPLDANAANGFAEKRSWSAWSPRLGLDYKLGDGAMLYGGWSRGQRSGGFNFRITNPPADVAKIAAARGTFSYDAERADSLEAGLKWSSSDDRASLNAAIFQSDVRNLQREVNLSDAGSGLVQSIFNTADARIRGMELEGRLALSPRFAITGNLGHIDAAYRRVIVDISGDNVITAADAALALPRSPRWTWGMGATASLPLGDDGSAIIARGNFQHRSRMAYTDSNFGWITALDQLDASLTWQTGLAPLRITLYGRNLLDEVQHGGDTQIPFGGALSDGNNRPFDDRPAGGSFSPVNKGRTAGVELSLRF